MWNLPMGVGLTLSTQQEGSVFLSQINVSGPRPERRVRGQKGLRFPLPIPLPSLARRFHLRVQEDSSNGSQHTHTPTSRQGKGEEGLAPLFKDTSQKVHTRRP